MSKVKNVNKVPISLWRTFKGDEAKRIFNSIMEQSSINQSLIVHPSTDLPEDEFHTIRWNFACFGAWASCNKENYEIAYE